MEDSEVRSLILCSSPPLPRPILLVLFFLISSSLLAQHDNELYNNGALIYVSPGDTVSVRGDVHNIGGSLLHNGFMKVQGHMYSDNSFQQAGNGTVRLQNDEVNATEEQFIQGSYAVRGGQNQIGVDDGSFYRLELANSQGIVWLNGNGNVCDVREGVEFQISGFPLNRIVTADPNALPANGASYPAVFGLLNPNPGLNALSSNTVSANGNMTGTDNAYVQGRFRRAILGTGGQYGYVLGLEPAGPSAARGVQYVRLDFGPNNYDVVEGYFQRGSPNVIPGNPVECGFNITYFGGTDHGEWVFSDQTGNGMGQYQVWIWPQDHPAPVMSTWFITKDDSIRGSIGDCGPSLIGLERNSFDGFSEFGFAGGSIIFPVTLADLQAVPMDNRYIQVHWVTVQETNLSHFEVERSLDNLNFAQIGMVNGSGNSSAQLSYFLDDHQVRPGVDYHYRLRLVDVDGAVEYTPSVRARLLPAALMAEAVLFPNPLHGDELQMSLELREAGVAQLTVVDALGRILSEWEVDLDAGQNKLTVETSGLAIGPYVISVRGKGYALQRKFVKAGH